MKQINNYFIASIWILNGLFCKIFNLVPRHSQIVKKILGYEHFLTLTTIIGCLEVVMAFWILSKIQSKLNAIAQIVIILIMNILEFFYAPELLLWGQLNAVFALIFVVFIYINEFNSFSINTKKAY
ncbi:DoxX-like family protein [Wenyingzhuangia sp. IMCC45574]